MISKKQKIPNEITKIILYLFFAFLLFANITVLQENKYNIKGDISMFGLEISFSAPIFAKQSAGCGGIIYREGNCQNGIEVYGFPCTSDFCGNVNDDWMCLIQLCQ